MRGKAVVVAVFTALFVAAIGCHHDKYGIRTKFKEEAYLPPTGQARFDNPPSEEYRKPPPKPQDKSLMGGGGGGAGMPGKMGINPGL